jgi:hypothetical protein
MRIVFHFSVRIVTIHICFTLVDTQVEGKSLKTRLDHLVKMAWLTLGSY